MEGARFQPSKWAHPLKISSPPQKSWTSRNLKEKDLETQIKSLKHTKVLIGNCWRMTYGLYGGGFGGGEGGGGGGRGGGVGGSGIGSSSGPSLLRGALSSDSSSKVTSKSVGPSWASPGSSLDSMAPSTMSLGRCKSHPKINNHNGSLAKPNPKFQCHMN